MASKYKIIWIDDEVELFEPHVRLLNKQNYEVKTSNNGYDAVSMIEKESFDLVFLDVMMPGKDGISVLDDIKSIKPALPVVMITKSEDEITVEESIALKADDYVVKPVQPSQLIAVCKKFLERGRLIDTRIPPRYTEELKSLKMNFESDDPMIWIETAKKINSWTLRLLESSDSMLREIHHDIRKEADLSFSSFLQRCYPDLITADDSPVFSHSFLEKVLLPLIDEKHSILFVIIDCMRSDQWTEISKFLEKSFSISSSYYYSIIPSATPYSRNSIFSGMTPDSTVAKFPEFLTILEQPHQNKFEKDFLLSFFRQVRGINDGDIIYKKILNKTGELSLLSEIEKMSSFLFSAVVVDFVDILSHSISRNPILEEMIHDEIALKKAAVTWFDNSPVMKTLIKAGELGMTVVITTDHGSVQVKTPAILKNAQGDVSANLRYKYGEKLNVIDKHRERAVVITDAKSWGLPSHGHKYNYVISTHDSFLVYPTNPEQYTKDYINTFQHGGISLDEVIIPYAVLKPR
ncbi:response regulator [candidate division WOR-3 bacterium]|nr:response regulator [candidate division WOR-3 bacterium]